MAETDWNRIEELFHEASEREEPERSSYLESACRDADERSLVERMLAHDSGPPTLLEAEPGQLASLLLDENESGDELPDRIGPYIVDRLIGRGGMGVVLLAERPDLPRKVALKLVRDRWIGSEAANRFKREQAVLARLQHPNIARLLNVGTADDGTPYLTMDFVDGQPVTDYCAEHRLSIEQKLSLSADICDAVRYAHQNLVVHRDLKPSNILVDGGGNVKLLDFGIAKLLEEERGDPETLTANRLMTPQYASPEQLAGQPVTTTTDVYSLGVVLYEILTGRRPYDLEGKSATEALRILTEEVPRRPSTVVESEFERRGLKGDLDNILMKALQRDPTARYGSVEAMLVDIQRHQKGFPVEAREATAAYRARKFISRHKAGVTVATGLVLLLTGFVVTISMQQAETARERDRAEREAAKAARTSEFLMGLFEASDPAQALGDSVSARELLERGVEQADALADDPHLQAETYAVIGNVYKSLGQHERAIALLKQAAEIQRGAPGSPEEDLASTLRNLSEVYSSSRQTDDAIRTAEEALQIAHRVSEPPSDEIARGLNSLGVALSAAGRYNEADSVLQASYEQMRASRKEDDDESIQVLANRLSVLHDEGHHDIAEPIARTVLEWRREHLPPNHPETAEAADALAITLRNLARYDEAEKLYEEALAIKTAVYGPNHPSTAASLLNLAIFHGTQGHYQAAEPYFRRAVEAYEIAFGRDNPRTANTLNMYAVLLSRTGRFDEAAEITGRALAILRDKLGPNHLNTLNAQFNLGTTLCNLHRFDEGIPMIRRVAEGYKQAMGADNSRYGDVLVMLGLQESIAGQAERGVQDATEGYEITRAALGEEDYRTARGLGVLGRALVEAGNYAVADSVLKVAYRHYTEQASDDDPSAIAIADGWGRANTHLGDYAKADSLLRKAYKVRLERLGSDHPWTQDTARHIQELYSVWGKPVPDDLKLVD